MVHSDCSSGVGRNNDCKLVSFSQLLSTTSQNFEKNGGYTYAVAETHNAFAFCQFKLMHLFVKEKVSVQYTCSKKKDKKRETFFYV